MIVLRYESLDNPCFQKTRRGGGGGWEFVGWGN